jgi:hypothetical protein
VNAQFRHEKTGLFGAEHDQQKRTRSREGLRVQTKPSSVEKQNEVKRSKESPKQKMSWMMMHQWTKST